MRLGIRADDSWHVVTQADGSLLRPRSAHVPSEMPNRPEDAAATVDGVLRAAINKRADDVG
jgi:hypothetical protein